jgi:hypothetical protein
MVKVDRSLYRGAEAVVRAIDAAIPESVRYRCSP